MSDLNLTLLEHRALIVKDMQQIRSDQALKMLDSIFGGQLLNLGTL